MDHKRFFGFHFDFHAGNETEIGLNTDPADIEWYIDQGNPDFIQCDCKGHPGNCSYPTKIGKPADKLMADNLRIWADTVHGKGLPLYVHYSGVWEKAYTAAHPENAALDKDGNVTERISVFGPYNDEILIPQMKELIDNYGINGCWIDGDCWAVHLDYSEHAKPFLHEGMTQAEHHAVMRKGFLDYVKKYTDAIHAHDPNFRVASNWLYTSQVPEKPEIDVDYISGDFAPNNSAHEARFQTRCISHQEKPWDLMAWSFGYDPNGTFINKPAAMLNQEAAIVLSQGGGFQIYVTQNKDGSARRERSNRFREISEFVHARRINFEKKPIAQVGIYYSAQSRYAQTTHEDASFNPPNVSDALIGAVHCVLDGQYTADVVLEHQIDTIDKYDILVIPEWTNIPGAHVEKLLDYARNGGNLLVIGATLTQQLCGQLSLPCGDIQENVMKSLITDKGEMTRFFSNYLDLTTGEGSIYSDLDLRYPEMPGYRIDSLDAGKIAFVPFDLGTVYHTSKTFYTRQYLNSIMQRLAQPWIRVNRKNIDMTLQEDGDAILLNLINMNQDRHSLEYFVFEEIPTVYNVEVILNKVYSQITMPLGEEFTWEIQDGKTIIRLPELNIHSIIRLQ